MTLFNMVFFGLVTGALYGITALGLVLAYRASRVLNFGLGGIGGAAAYSAFALLDIDMSIGVAIIAAIVTGAVLGALSELLVVRPLRGADPMTTAFATMGVLLILQGALATIWGYNTQPMPLPFAGTFSIDIGEATLGSAHLFILAVTGAVVIGSFLLVSRTKLGLSMRATSGGPLTASLLGIDTNQVRLASWILGGACGGVAAIFVTPMVYLDPTIFAHFLISAVAAMVLGGFTSMSGVLVGGLAFGVISNLISGYISPGLIKTTTFVVIMIVLMLRPHGFFGKPEQYVSEPAIKDVTRSSGSGQPSERVDGSVRLPLVQWGSYVVLLTILVIIPLVLPSQTYRMAAAVATFLAVHGINVLSGHSGQGSLGHSAFMAVGAYIAAVSMTFWGWPLPAAIVAGAVVSGVMGVMIGLPATRLSGLYLIVLTLAFGWTIPELLVKMDVVGSATGMGFPVPDALATNESKYWLVLAIAVIMSGITVWLERSWLGRSWRAVRDSEQGAKAIGLNVSLVKLTAFAWSATLAGFGGALMGMMVGFISPHTYDVWLSVYLILATIIGGTGSLIGSFIGALFITFMPNYLASFHISPDIIYGVVLIVLLLALPEGMISLPSVIRRSFGRRRVKPQLARGGAGE